MSRPACTTVKTVPKKGSTALGKNQPRFIDGGDRSIATVLASPSAAADTNAFSILLFNKFFCKMDWQVGVFLKSLKCDPINDDSVMIDTRLTLQRRNYCCSSKVGQMQWLVLVILLWWTLVLLQSNWMSKVHRSCSLCSVCLCMCGCLWARLCVISFFIHLPHQSSLCLLH